MRGPQLKSQVGLKGPEETRRRGGSGGLLDSFASPAAKSISDVVQSAERGGRQ